MLLRGGGISIQGVVEEYKVYAGENISAGSFVEFVNSIVVQPSQKVIQFLSTPIVIDDNTVFVSCGVNNRLTCALIKLNNNMQVTYLTLDSGSSSVRGVPSQVLIAPNTVFLAYSKSTSNYLYGAIVTINGTTVNAVLTQISSNTQSAVGQSLSCVLLDTNKVLIVHANTNLYTICGTIIEIVNNTINVVANSVQLYGSGGSVGFDIVVLEQNKLLINFDNNYQIGGLIVDIDNDNNITSTFNAITNESTTTNYGALTSSCLLEPNKVFTVSSYSNELYLYGTICQINGTTITSNSTILIDVRYISGSKICIKVNENRVVVVHSYDINQISTPMISTIDINGTDMSVNKTEFLQNNGQIGNYTSAARITSIILLNDNNYFSTDSSISHVWTIFNKEQLKPSSTKINGLAKTSGSSGETIEVYIPE